MSAAEGTQIYAGIDREPCPDLDIMESLFEHTNLWWTGFYLGYKSYQGKYQDLRKLGWGVAPIHFVRQPAGYCRGLQKDWEKKRETNPKLKPFDLAHCKTRSELNGTRDELFDQGILKGREAVRLARGEGIPAGTILYLDCEIPHEDKDWVSYFAGWIRAVNLEGYLHGLYSSYLGNFQPWLSGELSKRPVGLTALERMQPVIWGFKVVAFEADITAPFAEMHPNGSTPSAKLWQHSQNCNLRWNDPAHRKPRELLRVDLNTSVFRDPGKGWTSSINVLNKKTLRSGKPLPVFEHSGELKPEYQQSGQLTPAFRKAQGIK